MEISILFSTSKNRDFRDSSIFKRFLLTEYKSFVFSTQTTFSPHENHIVIKFIQFERWNGSIVSPLA